VVAITVAGALCAVGLPAVAGPPQALEPSSGPAASTDQLLTAPDAVSAAAIARLQDQPVEVLAERSEAGSVFVLPDGRGEGCSNGPDSPGHRSSCT
jgi:hypothetical protein